jgi:Bacterial regulatory helix-turn-helix protein, lysR family
LTTRPRGCGVALFIDWRFAHAAERIFVAQPTLSQQIRRLEEMVGTPLLQRRREGLPLTAAGHFDAAESPSAAPAWPRRLPKMS